MKLQHGDIVDLIAPSSGFSKEEYKSCLKLLESFGLKACVPEYDELIDESSIFCANSAQKRFQHLEKALNNPDSKAIWCLSGGYGAYQLLEYLDSIPMPIQEKIFIGYSDVTALINYFIGKWNWQNCIYAANLVEIAEGKKTKESIKNLNQIILGEEESVTIELESINNVAKKGAMSVGKIVGGCLSIMQIFLGSKQDFDLKGRIVFIEDDEFETPGRINRILDHLLRAGKFDEIAAVVLGSLNGNKEDAGLKKTIDCLGEKLDNKKIPLLRNKNIGHVENMISLPLGRFADISLGEKAVVNINI